MGRTKALVDVDGTPMAGHVIAALDEAGCEPIVVYGGDAAELAALPAPVIPDLYPGEGPVGGVLGALTWCAAGGGAGAVPDAVLVVACDLPALDAVTLRRLLDEHADDAPGDVIVASTGRRQPLCALWSIEAVAKIAAAFGADVRSMQRLLDLLDVIEVAVEPAALRNVNSPSDLKSDPST